MKDRKTFLIILLLLTIILAVTNPTKQDYIDWAKQTVVNNSNSNFEKAFVDLIGGSILNDVTTTKNFVIFSLFETNIDGTQKYITVGILKNFILLNNDLGLLIIILLINLIITIIFLMLFFKFIPNNANNNEK
ncbi:hypothetical protein [Thermoanaerobacterium thermosaccharolyticum]|uniref:hypothetical protein n=1 Tax=Thermoanaerobacterium thermosaccharolyticum TaxID=1517 RepID=UPI003DA8199C